MTALDDVNLHVDDAAFVRCLDDDQRRCDLVDARYGLQQLMCPVVGLHGTHQVAVDVGELRGDLFQRVGEVAVAVQDVRHLLRARVELGEPTLFFSIDVDPGKRARVVVVDHARRLARGEDHRVRLERHHVRGARLDSELEAHARLAGVVADDSAHCGFRHFHLGILDAIVLGLLRQQIPLRNIDLLVFRVSRQANHFHPVQQRRRDVHRV